MRLRSRTKNTHQAKNNTMLFWLIFLVALLATLATDYFYLIIHRAATLFLVPIFLMGAVLRSTPVTASEAMLGFLVGYGFLWIFKMVYQRYRGVDGLGQGDLELLGTIGTFVGPLGALYTVTYGSIVGTLVATAMLLLKRADAQTQLPFGVFLVLGCLGYCLSWRAHLL